MTPSASDGSFWAHIPSFAWPIIVLGIIGFFLYEIIRGSESVAHVFGGLGRYIHENTGRRKIDRKLDRIIDKLDCSMSFLAVDAEWHRDADIIIAENCPGVLKKLPRRIAFTEFARRWGDGERPPFFEGAVQ